MADAGGDPLDDDNSAAVYIKDSDDSSDWTLPVTAGDVKTFSYGTAGQTVRVVRYGPNNGSSAVLGSQEAPS